MKINSIKGKISDLEEQIILHITDANFLSLGTPIWAEFPEALTKYQEYCKEDSNPLGSVQYVIISKDKKIIGNLSAFFKDKIDFKYLELCLVQAAHKCRAPVAFIIPKKLEKDIEKITSLLEKIFKDREITIYLERTDNNV